MQCEVCCNSHHLKSSRELQEEELMIVFWLLFRIAVWSELWRLWIFFLSNPAELCQKTSTNNFSPANWLIALKRGDHKGPYSTEKKHRKIHRPFFQGSIHLHRQKCHPSGPPVQFRGFLLSLLDFWLSSHLLSWLRLQCCCRFRQELFRHLLGFDAERRFFYLMKLVTEFLRL